MAQPFSRFSHRIVWVVFASLVLAAFTQARAETPPLPTFPATPQAIRESFFKIIDRPKVPAEYFETVIATDEPIQRINFTYMSDATHRVPGILYRPSDKTVIKRAVVLVLHGTGGSKDGQIRELKTLAGRGFIAIAIDGRYHGERKKDGDYNEAVARAFANGGEHPLYFDTVWDIMRLLDILQARPDVDASRVGVMGISKGGIETWLLAAVDERVAVAVPCICMQSFKWGLENGAWPKRVGTVKKGFDAAAKAAGVDKPDAAFAKTFYDHLLPGITEQFDGPSMITLITPRPLLVIAGDEDPLNPLTGLKICMEAGNHSYAKANVTDQFQVMIQRGTGHNVTTQAHAAAVEWFVKWLKP